MVKKEEKVEATDLKDVVMVQVRNIKGGDGEWSVPFPGGTPY